MTYHTTLSRTAVASTQTSEVKKKNTRFFVYSIEIRFELHIAMLELTFNYLCKILKSKLRRKISHKSQIFVFFFQTDSNGSLSVRRKNTIEEEQQHRASDKKKKNTETKGEAIVFSKCHLTDAPDYRILAEPKHGD